MRIRSKSRTEPDRTCLSWFVWIENVNARRIEHFNIFLHGGFLSECREAAQKYGDDRERFEDAVDKSMRYYYWCKCEWEIVLDSWPPRADHAYARKVDVFTQVMLNEDHFMDYIWEHREELAKGL